jgi:RimJ/RimL family protein N-acetyltransferase
VIFPIPVTLESHGVRLEPLEPRHADGLSSAVLPGELWKLWFTQVPEPNVCAEYIERALAGLDAGAMLPWAVCEAHSGEVLGSTRFHDIVPDINRVEIGYTWYTKPRQKTALNSICKLILLRHAFDDLGCQVVGLRTDNFNLNSQRAIAAIGAKKDGVIRHHMMRRDGSVRDTVMFSILATEWHDVRKHLELRIARMQA